MKCLCVLAAVLAAALAGCTTTPDSDPVPPAPSAVQGAAAPPPPAPAEGDNAAGTQDISPSAEELTAAAKSRNREPQRRLFPGLEQAEKPADGELPFEQGVAERRKRIDLGLEAPSRAEQPVNNVIDWDF